MGKAIRYARLADGAKGLTATVYPLGRVRIERVTTGIGPLGGDPRGAGYLVKSEYGAFTGAGRFARTLVAAKALVAAAVA